jgi:hypothetical protein
MALQITLKRHIPSVGVYVGDFFFAGSFHGREKRR